MHSTSPRTPLLEKTSMERTCWSSGSSGSSCRLSGEAGGSRWSNRRHCLQDNIWKSRRQDLKECEAGVECRRHRVRRQELSPRATFEFYQGFNTIDVEGDHRISKEEFCSDEIRLALKPSGFFLSISSASKFINQFSDYISS